MNSEDRRAPGAPRTPFEGLVEVGGALGPSFEAQAVNVSEDGMALRTAYLPEVGQPLSCRFDAGSGQSVLASAEVVWAQAAERGGEFGIHFVDVDSESVEALKRACGVEQPPPVQPGSKVRLHIDGLASPMRAKIKDADPTAVTVGSELGFLRVGKQLELEDAQSGDKRPASIERVDVTVDPTSRVPQLVVTLRYAGASASHAAPGEAHEARPAPVPARGADDLQAVEEASVKMKGAFAHHIARIGPALEGFAQRAKTTLALLAKKRGGRAFEEAPGLRRTTAPAPGGGLHATGRRVVRGEATPAAPEPQGAAPKLALTKRKAAVGAAVMVAAILAALAIKKGHHDGASAQPAPANSASADSLPAQAAQSGSPPAALAPSNGAAAPPAASPENASGLGLSPAPSPAPLADNGDDAAPRASHKKHAHPAPFANGPVHHGNVLHLKMDGPIESIEGAQQPTGFTVKLPGRKSLEAAGPLAARDSRIASIKVSNETAGAELTVVFKDGVPNYQVSGKGDTLAIAIAPAGTLDKTLAKKDEKGGRSSKHPRHHKHPDDSAPSAENPTP